MTDFYRRQGGALVRLSSDEAVPYLAGEKRHAVVNGVRVVFTAGEEAAADAAEDAWSAGAARRTAEDAEARLGKDRGDRDIAIATLAADHPRRLVCESVEQLWVVAGVRRK